MFAEEVIERGTLELLEALGERPELDAFFLVGGTALALQICHRRSEDLDFFTRDPFDEEAVLRVIREVAGAGRTRVIGKAENTLNLVVHGVKVDFLRHGYDLLKPLIGGPGCCRLADPADIAAMKLSAVTNRGSRKDFVDLFFLLRRFSLAEMLRFYERKYTGHDVFPVLKSLTYFEDAEQEPDPVMLEAVAWDAVRAGITDAVREAG